MARIATFRGTLSLGGANGGDLRRTISQITSSAALLFDAEVTLPASATTLTALCGSGMSFTGAKGLIFIPDSGTTASVYWDSTGTGTASVVGICPDGFVLPAGASVAGTAKLWASAGVLGELIIF